MADAKKYTSKLTDTRVLIFGGSSGIGYAVAEASLEYGAQVIISSSNSSRVDTAIERLTKSYPSAKNRVSGHACDLSSSSSLEANIERLFGDVGGKLDHIVFTAGTDLAVASIEDFTLEKIQQAGMVRFCAPLLLAKHAKKHLNPGPKSSITLTTGAVSQRPMPNWSIVASYGAGMHGMTRNLALDLAPIRVNLVSPGAVDTELWDGMPKEQKAGMMEVLKTKMTTGQVGKPEDVAESYLFSMKDVNCSGTVINTNGGTLLL